MGARSLSGAASLPRGGALLIRAAVVVATVAAALTAGWAAWVFKWLTCEEPSSRLCEQQAAATVQVVLAIAALVAAVGVAAALWFDRDRLSSGLVAATIVPLLVWGASVGSVYG